MRGIIEIDVILELTLFYLCNLYKIGSSIAKVLIDLTQIKNPEADDVQESNGSEVSHNDNSTNTLSERVGSVVGSPSLSEGVLSSSLEDNDMFDDTGLGERSKTQELSVQHPSDVSTRGTIVSIDF